MTAPVTAPTSAPTAGVPVNAPTVANPVPVPTNANLNTTTDELREQDKILIGVLIGVGVPVLAGATTLIVLRKRLVKKPDDEDSIYTAIDLLSKDDPLFEKKMIIPFKQLTFTKEIGSGSFGKVFLGYVTCH